MILNLPGSQDALLLEKNKRKLRNVRYYLTVNSWKFAVDDNLDESIGYNNVNN